MSYNGAGVWSANSTGLPVVTGTTISSTMFNAFTGDVATGLSTALLKDGTQTVTANIPFNSNRLTGVAAGTATTDAANLLQVQNGAPTLLGTVAGTNTITATLTPAITAYASGQKFILTPAATNTAASTLNISSVGAKSIFKNGAALVGGELRISLPVLLEYDGTQFNILANSATTDTKATAVVSATTTDIWAISGDFVHITGTTTITGLGTAPYAGARREVIFDGALTLTHNATTLVLPGAANITTAANDRMIVRADTTANMIVVDYIKASGKPVINTANTQPTRQVFTTGSGTYNRPANVTRINVRLIGAGGGGTGNAASAGGAGGNTTFDTLTGSGSAGVAGGAASGGDINIPGGAGGGIGQTSTANTFMQGGHGGNGAFGGGGAQGTGNASGGNGATNSGAGGGGGGGASGGNSGSGGGAGGYVEKLILAPSATYSYGVGAGGTGTTGTASTGGTGAAGIIIVDEWYD